MQSREKEFLEEVMAWPSSNSTTRVCETIASLHQEELADFKIWGTKLRTLRDLVDDVKLILPCVDIHSIGASCKSKATSSQEMTMQSVDTSALHALMDRIYRSPYLKSTLTPLVGKESALLSSREVALCIEQVFCKVNGVL
jgi:hypothetical protein